MTVYLEFTTNVIALDGKPMVLDIEAKVCGDKIVSMKAWYNEVAGEFNLQILSEKLQFELEQQVWAKADEKFKRRSELLFSVMAEGNLEYVNWINRGSQ